MRLYKVHATPATPGPEVKRVVKWGGSMAEARAAKKEIVAKHGVKASSVSMDETEVPTNKAGLIAWLNENVRS